MILRCVLWLILRLMVSQWIHIPRNGTWKFWHNFFCSICVLDIWIRTSEKLIRTSGSGRYASGPRRHAKLEIHFIINHRYLQHIKQKILIYSWNLGNFNVESLYSIWKILYKKGIIEWALNSARTFAFSKLGRRITFQNTQKHRKWTILIRSFSNIVQLHQIEETNTSTGQFISQGEYQFRFKKQFWSRCFVLLHEDERILHKIVLLC